MPPGRCAVVLEGLSRQYSPAQAEPVVALDDLTFTARPGEIVALVGPNGAGKTTVLKAIAGLITPSSGSVAVTTDGITVERREPLVSLLLENSNTSYPRLSVRENVEFFAGLAGLRRRSASARARMMIDRLGLAERQDSPTQLLSRGMRQRLSLACVLVKDAPVLLLDEPTLGIDAATMATLDALLRELVDDGHTIIVCSHDFSLVENVASRVAILNRGRLVAIDSPRNLRQLPPVLRYDVVAQVPADFDATAVVIDGASVRDVRGTDVHLDVVVDAQRTLSGALSRCDSLGMRVLSVRLSGYDLATSVEIVLGRDS